MRVKVKDRRETANPLNIVPEIEVIVKEREIGGVWTVIFGIWGDFVDGL